MIQATHLKTELRIPSNIPEDDKKTIVYAAENYGFVIQNRMPHTFGEFADLISAIYDINEPRNQVIVDTLKRYADQ